MCKMQKTLFEMNVNVLEIIKVSKNGIRKKFSNSLKPCANAVICLTVM